MSPSSLGLYMTALPGGNRHLGPRQLAVGKAGRTGHPSQALVVGTGGKAPFLGQVGGNQDIHWTIR